MVSARFIQGVKPTLNNGYFLCGDLIRKYMLQFFVALMKLMCSLHMGKILVVGISTVR